MFRKEEKKPIIKIFLGFLFADKSYVEKKYLVDFLEAVGFLAGIFTSFLLLGFHSPYGLGIENKVGFLNI